MSPPTAPIAAMIHGRSASPGPRCRNARPSPLSLSGRQLAALSAPQRMVKPAALERHEQMLTHSPKSCPLLLLTPAQRRMCARRFLMLIFILTLIFVGGAVALYQWGDQVLSGWRRPEDIIAPPARAARTIPPRRTGSRWPETIHRAGRRMPAAATDEGPAAAAHDLLCPSDDLSGARSLERADRRPQKPTIAPGFRPTQASAFNDVDVWAPRYRQAAYGAFLLKSDDAHKALDLAYRMCSAAFDGFSLKIPATADPAAGHSQGALHLLRLLADRKQGLQGAAGRGLCRRLAGGHFAPAATGLALLHRRGQPGCLSWQSFKDPANPGLVPRPGSGPGLAGGAHRRRECSASIR